MGPCGLVLSNSKVDKVTPLFFIKTINKGCRVASKEMRCSFDEIVFIRESAFSFFFFRGRRSFKQLRFSFHMRAQDHSLLEGLITLVVHLHYI